MVAFIFTGTIIFYIMTVIFPYDLIFQVLSIFALSSILISYLKVKPIVKFLSGVLLAGGLTTMLMNGAGLTDLLFSFGNMMNLLSLFALVPLMAIPMRLGNYAQSIQEIIYERVKSSGSLYVLTSCLSYFLAIFMNLAALPMMYYAIRQSADLYPVRDKERFMSRAITHGFSMTVLWTPLAPIVGIVIEMTGVSWASVLPLVLMVSFLGLALDLILGTKEARRARKQVDSGFELNLPDREEGRPSPYRKIAEICFAIFLLGVLIILLENVIPYGFLFIVLLLIVPFGFVWSLLIRKGKQYWKEVAKHPKDHLPKMKDQFVIFLSAGFFITAIRWSGFDQTISLFFSDFKDLVGAHVFVIILPLIIYAMSFTGLHPAVTLALVAQAVDPQVLGLSPLLLSVAMLSGAASSFLMGPYTATMGLMSGIVKRSPYQVSNWNFPYTASYLIMVMIFLLILELIL